MPFPSGPFGPHMLSEPPYTNAPSCARGISINKCRGVVQSEGSKAYGHRNTASASNKAECFFLGISRKDYIEVTLEQRLENKKVLDG